MKKSWNTLKRLYSVISEQLLKGFDLEGLSGSDHAKFVVADQVENMVHNALQFAFWEGYIRGNKDVLNAINHATVEERS